MKEVVYEDYRQQAGGRPKASYVFWKELYGICGVSSHQLRVLSAPSVVLVQFPPLQECRSRFCKKMGNESWKFEVEQEEETQQVPTQAQAQAAAQQERERKEEREGSKEGGR